jgi:hypothetical protein
VVRCSLHHMLHLSPHCSLAPEPPPFEILSYCLLNSTPAHSQICTPPSQAVAITALCFYSGLAVSIFQCPYISIEAVQSQRMYIIVLPAPSRYTQPPKQFFKCTAEYVEDKETGKVIYGYTMDSCADNNFWCRKDDFHLDISEPYLDTLGYQGDIWNGRKVSWDYISSAPKGCDSDSDEAPVNCHACVRYSSVCVAPLMHCTDALLTGENISR